MSIVYTPTVKYRNNPIKIWIQVINNVISSKELIWVLFKRDFLSVYRKSFIGVFWIFISPVIGILSWVFLNRTGVLNPGDVGVPFEVYVLIGSSVWGLFMGFYSSSAGTLGAGSEFIMQVKYPHEVLLFKQIAVQLANFSISFALNIGVIILFGVVPEWEIILFPLAVLPLFFLASSLGLVISLVSVVASDISNFFNILLGFVFYITPVIYSQNDKTSLLYSINEFNPLTYLIAAPRDLIFKGDVEYIERYLIISLISFLFFIWSIRLFYISEGRVVERMI